MDFAIWSILESDVCRISYSSVSQLKVALTKSWFNLGEDIVKKSCASVEKRLKGIVAVRGGHFEFQMLLMNIIIYLERLH